MTITKTPLMYALLSSTLYQTHKSLREEDMDMIRASFGESVLQQLKDSDLYEYDGDTLYIAQHFLSANIFEEIADPITEENMGEFMEYYMKNNGMWPLERSIPELVSYSMNTALPSYIKAGLLAVS